MKSEPALAFRGDWKWPGKDKFCWPTVQKELAEIPVILELVTNRRVCVQAGGNGGLWVLPFADAFDQVYTFEPDPMMFRCLVHNVDRQNVVFINGALDEEPGMIAVDRWCGEQNPGANRIDRTQGSVPSFRLDDFRFNHLDLLQLDIEGAEMLALKGAQETIKAHKPVIVLELRNHAGHYGSTDKQIRQFVHSLGYTTAGTMNHDEFFIPA